MSDLDLNELLATFIDETGDDVAQLETCLLALETTPHDRDLQSELLRRAHTIKGNASCVGFTAMTAFAHAYEEVLERVHDGSVEADTQLVTLLLEGIDAFRRFIEDGGNTLTAGDEELIAKLGSTAGSASVEPAAADVYAAAAPLSRARTVRVAAEKLNRMLDLAGEIAIARGLVQQLATATPLDSAAVLAAEQQIDQLQNELRELIMRARMVPVGSLFRGYARTVRDLSATHGKNARLVMSGEDVEVDTATVELLRDPLTHMIRNSIDHGIEPSSLRVAAGKPAVGEIALRARHEAGAIVITVSDDGAGLDAQAIAARAQSLGLDVSHLSEAETYGLIFEAGFSTSPEISDLSGRGVGMDVVRRSIDSLRGTIAIDTRAGEGTTLTLRLPLTLALIDGFAVSAAGETYIVPMERVVECIELPPSESTDAASGILLLRDEIVPYVRLRVQFGLAGAPPGRENALIVQNGEKKAAFAVDALLGGTQALIKPLGEFFEEVPGIAGSSILGSGRVALVLDTAAIFRNAIQTTEVSA